MVKKYWLLICILTACTSASMTENRIFKSKVRFNGGASKNQTWTEPVEFKRISWQRGIHLIYDVIYWKVDKNSPFVNWFADDEKEYMDKCSPLIITMNYYRVWGGSFFTYAMFKAQMDKAGFTEYIIPDFTDAISMHPDYEMWRLKQHQVKAFCRKSEHALRGNYVYIDIPNFPQTHLNLE
ncbi:MAG: hypothetical protein JNM93_07830 [Bacteriovoracaceae bacterium]|nr:hypothetical protein [Bacteriovoracaceae bacterium]